MKESNILTFQQFNESYATLSRTDLDILDDLCLDLVEDWDLKSSINGSQAVLNNKGYLSLQMFSRFQIEFSVQLYSDFDIDTNMEQFQKDLLNLVERIKKFGYEVRVNTWDSRIFFTSTFSFTISHSEEKSQEIFKTT